MRCWYPAAFNRSHGGVYGYRKWTGKQEGKRSEAGSEGNGQAWGGLTQQPWCPDRPLKMAVSDEFPVGTDMTREIPLMIHSEWIQRKKNGSWVTAQMSLCRVSLARDGECQNARPVAADSAGLGWAFSSVSLQVLSAGAIKRTWI